MFAREKTGCVDGIQGTELNLSEQTEPINETKTNANEKIKTTQTYWARLMSSSDFKYIKYYELFINNGKNYDKCWISSRCTYANLDNTAYGIFKVSSGGDIKGDDLFQSNGWEFLCDYAFRPVITLNSDVQVTSGNGSESAPFEIK